MLSSQGLVLATAMAVSAGTIIILDLLRDKYFPNPQIPQNQDSFPQKQRILRSCLSSGDRKKESKKKKKKRVHFAEDVKDSIGNGEEYRRQFEMVNQRRFSCGKESVGGNKGIPANRVALYVGVLKDRLQRMEYSY